MNEPSQPERDAPLVDWSSREIEPGSFRDRNGRVFYRDNAVLRGLSQEALENWELLSSKEFFHRLLADRKVVGTERVGRDSIANLPELQGWAAYLRHETIPFVSYPYEWSFGMLKDAALLHLELLTAALEEANDIERCFGVQRALAGNKASFHRHPIVSVPSSWRAVDWLPAVLPDVPIIRSSCSPTRMCHSIPGCGEGLTALTRRTSTG